VTTLLCLHGWGGSSASFTELRAALAKTDITILTPDLPGFGAEPEPAHPFTVEEYANWVEAYLKKELPNTDHKSLCILGHSHGGRIGIVLASRKTLPITHLYLCAAAGIRRPRHFKRLIGLMLAKTGKFFLSIPGLKQLAPLGKNFLYKLVRVHDYEQASPLMRQTLILVTQEDLRPLLPQISIPTDLFWGTEDGMTPLADGQLMHQLIPGSRLHTYPGVRHAVHRAKATEIAEVITATLLSK
jgi:pimeloyl-ACP methyl ester carboxylesterase